MFVVNSFLKYSKSTPEEWHSFTPVEIVQVVDRYYNQITDYITSITKKSPPSYRKRWRTFMFTSSQSNPLFPRTSLQFVCAIRSC